jgi:hypothetical protein
MEVIAPVVVETLSISSILNLDSIQESREHLQMVMYNIHTRHTDRGMVSKVKDMGMGMVSKVKDIVTFIGMGTLLRKGRDIKPIQSIHIRSNLILDNMDTHSNPSNSSLIRHKHPLPILTIT